MTLGFNPEIKNLTTKMATDNPIAQDGWSQDEGSNPALQEIVQHSISSASHTPKAPSLMQRQITLDDSAQHECVHQTQPGLTSSSDVQNLENQIDEFDQLINDCDQMINADYQHFKNAPVCDKPGKIDEILKLLALKGRLLEKKAELLDRIVPLAYRSHEQVLNIRQAMNDSLVLNKHVINRFSQLKDISIESYRHELISEKIGMISLINERIKSCDQIEEHYSQQVQEKGLPAIAEIKDTLLLKLNLLGEKAKLQQEIMFLADPVLQQTFQSDHKETMNQYESTVFCLDQYHGLEIQLTRPEQSSEPLTDQTSHSKHQLESAQNSVNDFDSLISESDDFLRSLFFKEAQASGRDKLPAIAEIKDTLSLKLNLLGEKAKLQQEIIFLTDPAFQQTFQSEFQITLDQYNSTLTLLKQYKEFETSMAGRQEISEALQIEILEKELEMQTKLQTVNRFYGVVLDSRTDLHPDSKWLPGGWSDCENLIMKKEIEEFIEQNRQRLPQEEIKHLEACANSLENATQLERDQRVKPQETAEKVRKQIEQLKDGEALLLSGGTKRHAIVYEVRRKNEDYIFTIINTGDDEIGKEQRNGQLDPMPREHGEHKQLRYAHKAYLCSLSALDIEFIEQILPIQSDKLIAADHYQNVSQMMARRNASPIYGRLHHLQGGNSCALKSISSWLKGDLMIQFGDERGKALHAQFQVFRAEKRIAEMKEFEKENSELVGQIYSAISTEDLQQKIEIRDLAVQQVLEKRRRKAGQH